MVSWDGCGEVPLGTRVSQRSTPRRGTGGGLAHVPAGGTSGWGVRQLPVLLRDRDLVADGLREWC
ncbi:hypothetical protein GCM10027270_13640 [Nocardioides ginkgobilobae]|jgi:hypothetical protein